MGDLLDFATTLSDRANADDKLFSKAWALLQTFSFRDQCLILAQFIKTLSDEEVADWLQRMFELYMAAKR